MDLLAIPRNAVALTYRTVKWPFDRVFGGDPREEAAEAERERAERLRTTAEERVETTRRRAAEVEQARKAANRKATSKTEAVIDEQAKRERLEALEKESDALQERAEAVTAEDEAQRLGQAAARVKAERKSDS